MMLEASLFVQGVRHGEGIPFHGRTRSLSWGLEGERPREPLCAFPLRPGEPQPFFSSVTSASSAVTYLNCLDD